MRFPGRSGHEKGGRPLASWPRWSPSARLKNRMISKSRNLFLTSSANRNKPLPPRPIGGAFRDRLDTWGRVAMDAASVRRVHPARRKRCRVRRSRVVLAPRPWRLSMPARAGMATVTKNAAHRGEHEGNRKTIARGKPGCLGCTCLIRVRCFLFCTRCCGRSQRLAFPAPSVRERDDEFAELGQIMLRECDAVPTFVVIPGRAKREPGIHNHRVKLFGTAGAPSRLSICICDYGFRARAKRRAPE
jgi:hypothetical protein